MLGVISPQSLCMTVGVINCKADSYKDPETRRASPGLQHHATNLAPGLMFCRGNFPAAEACPISRLTCKLYDDSQVYSYLLLVHWSRRDKTVTGRQNGQRKLCNRSIT